MAKTLFWGPGKEFLVQIQISEKKKRHLSKMGLGGGGLLINMLVGGDFGPNRGPKTDLVLFLSFESCRSRRTLVVNDAADHSPCLLGIFHVFLKTVSPLLRILLKTASFHRPKVQFFGKKNGKMQFSE